MSSSRSPLSNDMGTGLPRGKRRPPTILVLDGGLGTTLKDQYDAAVDGVTRPLWSSHLLVSDPTKLSAVQTAFADAGADVILTATYQASFEGFARTVNPKDGSFGIPAVEAANYMRSAIGISRSSFRARADLKDSAKVALSLGAYGSVMLPSQEYSGKYDPEHMSVVQLADWHKRRLDVFASESQVWKEVSIVAFETIPLLAEIEAARQAMWVAQQVAGRLKKPFWISCVFPGKELYLPDGSSVDEVMRAMLGKRENGALPFAVGINCTKIGKVPDLLKEYQRAVCRLVEAKELEQWPALVIYPDGTNGEVYNTSTHEWEIQEEDANLISWDQALSDIVVGLRSEGLWSSIIVGGCCKTTPDDIRKLRQRIDGMVK